VLDVLITEGEILDGTWAPAFRADVGIEGDQIGRALAGQGARR
jgi:N-acyl-D-aspartate/D-glutamate deacylase